MLRNKQQQLREHSVTTGDITLHAKQLTDFLILRVVLVDTEFKDASPKLGPCVLYATASREMIVGIKFVDCHTLLDLMYQEGSNQVETLLLFMHAWHIEQLLPIPEPIRNTSHHDLVHMLAQASNWLWSRDPPPVIPTDFIETVLTWKT